MPKEEVKVSTQDIQDIINEFNKTHELESCEVKLGLLLSKINAHQPTTPKTISDYTLTLELALKASKFYFTATEHLLKQKSRDTQACWLYLHTAAKYLLIVNGLHRQSAYHDLLNSLPTKIISDLKTKFNTFRKHRDTLEKEITTVVNGYETLIKSNGLNELTSLQQIKLAETCLWFAKFKRSHEHYNVARVICKTLSKQSMEQPLVERAHQLYIFAVANMIQLYPQNSSTNKSIRKYGRGVMPLYRTLRNEISIIDKKHVKALSEYNAYSWAVDTTIQHVEDFVEAIESKTVRPRKRSHDDKGELIRPPAKKTKLTPPLPVAPTTLRV